MTTEQRRASRCNFSAGSANFAVADETGAYLRTRHAASDAELPQRRVERLLRAAARCRTPSLNLPHPNSCKPWISQ